MQANSVLEKQTDRLSKEAENISNVEVQLQRIVSGQGSSVSSFIELVREQAFLLEAMNKLLIEGVVQQLITIIIRVDRDQNFLLSDMEVNEVIIRIRSIKGAENIDEAHLRNVLKRNNGIENVINILKTMLDNSVTSHNQVSSRRAKFLKKR